MPDPCNERQVRFPARTPTNPATTPNPHNDAAQMGAGGVGADPRRAPNVTRPAGRRDRVVTAIVALLAASSCIAFATSAHAAPRPNTPHPLDYNARTIARALPEWGINTLEQADASGWYWTPTRSVCTRTRAAHYRCDATGSWSTVGEPGVRVTYRLRYCTSSRRIGNHALYRDGAVWRARIRVDYRGGLACRVPNPPYIPAS